MDLTSTPQKAQYSVTSADRAGCTATTRHATFAGVLASARTLYCRHGNDLALLVCNDDRADCDSDGLTDDERELLADATG